MGALLAFLFSPIGRIVAIAGVSLLAVSGAYFKGDIHGRSEVQAKWDAANAADIKRGEEARTQAEQYVAKNPPRIYPGGTVGSVPNDKWNRDKGAVRTVAPYSLLGQQGHPADRRVGKSTQHDGATPGVLVTVPSCAMISWAIAHLPQEKLCEYQKTATPAQIEAGKKCNAGEIKCPAG